MTAQAVWFSCRLLGYLSRKILAVTADDIQRVARKYLNPETLQLVAVGDAARSRRVLEKYGTWRSSIPTAPRGRRQVLACQSIRLLIMLRRDGRKGDAWTLSLLLKIISPGSHLLFLVAVCKYNSATFMIMESAYGG